MSQESKAISEFTKVLHNELTKKNYLYHLKKYLEWADKAPDQAIDQEIRTIQDSLENYVTFLSNEGHKRAYQKLSISSLALFFGMNYREINKTRLAKMISPNEDVVMGLAYSDEDIKKILEAIPRGKLTKRRKKPFPIRTAKRTTALIHFLAASGCRIGAVPHVRFKDLERIEDCYSVLVYEGTSSEYRTFLTPQASKSLDEYIKTRDFAREEEVKIIQGREELLPRDEMRIFFLNEDALKRFLHRLIRRAGIDRTYEGKRYNKPTNHAFRKRFNTKLKSNKDINPNLIELMMGHTSIIALDKHYLKPTKEKLFEEYKKGIDSLTIQI